MPIAATQTNRVRKPWAGRTRMQRSVCASRATLGTLGFRLWGLRPKILANRLPRQVLQTHHHHHHHHQDNNSEHAVFCRATSPRNTCIQKPFDKHEGQLTLCTLNLCAPAAHPNPNRRNAGRGPGHSYGRHIGGFCELPLPQWIQGCIPVGPIVSFSAFLLQTEGTCR